MMMLTTMMTIAHLGLKVKVNGRGNAVTQSV